MAPTFKNVLSKLISLLSPSIVSGAVEEMLLVAEKLATSEAKETKRKYSVVSVGPTTPRLTLLKSTPIMTTVNILLMVGIYYVIRGGTPSVTTSFAIIVSKLNMAMGPPVTSLNISLETM